MNVPTTKRATARAKLQKGLTEKGAEYYYSRKPNSKKSDHAVTKAKPTPPKARAITVKKK